VDPSWCYRALNYDFAPIGSDPQIFLAAEATKGNCNELLEGKDENVEFGFDETLQEVFWAAVDVVDSAGFPNKFGIKANFCLTVDAGVRSCSIV